MIYSTRDDGFCQRLKSLLRVIRASEIFNEDYRFIWRKKGGEYGAFHACEDVLDVFSKEYVKRKHVTELPGIVDVSAMELSKGVTGNYNIIEGWDFLDSRGENYSREFSSIGFSDSINSAITFGKTIDIGSKPVAVHVRGGDICYGVGKNNSFEFQDKVITIPLAKDIARRSDGRVIFFCQDEGFKEKLTGVENAIFPEDLCKDLGMSKLESLMFDVILMSRCEAVFGGKSAVPEVAAMIAGAKQYHPLDKYSPEDIASISRSGELFSDCAQDDDIIYFSLINSLYYSILSECNQNDIKDIVKEAVSVNPNSFQSLFFGYVYEREFLKNCLLGNKFSSSDIDKVVKSNYAMLKNSGIVSQVVSSSGFTFKAYKAWLASL